MTTPKKNTVFTFLLLAYTVLPFVVLNFRALDSGGPRFLALGILNLISLSYLIRTNKKRDIENKTGLFSSTWIGLFYSLFIAFSLLSFVNSINLNESVVYFTKVLSIFITTHILYVIIASNREYIKWIAIALSVLLLVDSFAVLIGISKYISRSIDAVSDIVFIYSNKNILASAIFIKMAAAVWLFFFHKSWYRVLAYAAAFMGMLSTFLLSTRSFYVGLLVILLCLLAFVLVRFLINRDKAVLNPLVGYLVILIVSLGSFTLIQSQLYPKEEGVLNKDVVSRISTIADSQANSNRIDSWKRTLNLIHENPVLGVGSGNWKLRILKYENPSIPEFKYMYRNHNDFLEVTAETGVLGGASYLMIFIVLLLGFLVAILKKQGDPKLIQLMAFAAIGIIAYGIDAFFNFPANRIELQILFALIIASAASLSDRKVKFPSAITSGTGMRYYLILTILSLGSVFILFQNYNSLKIQRLVKEDIELRQYSRSTALKVHDYPAFPNINAVGGPIVIDKIRYLINDKKLDKAKELIQNDKSSPYDLRKEFYLGRILAMQGQLDSAMHVLEDFRKEKPAFQPGIDLYSTLLYDLSNSSYSAGEYEKTLDLTDKLLLIRPDYVEILPIRAFCYFLTLKFDLCLETINQMTKDIQDLPKLRQLKASCEEQLKDKGL